MHSSSTLTGGHESSWSSITTTGASVRWNEFLHQQVSRFRSFTSKFQFRMVKVQHQRHSLRWDDAIPKRIFTQVNRKSIFPEILRNFAHVHCLTVLTIIWTFIGENQFFWGHQKMPRPKFSKFYLWKTPVFRHLSSTKLQRCFKFQLHFLHLLPAQATLVLGGQDEAGLKIKLQTRHEAFNYIDRLQIPKKMFPPCILRRTPELFMHICI